MNDFDLSQAAACAALGSIKSLTEIPSTFTGIRNMPSTNSFYPCENKGAATKNGETPCMASAEAHGHASGIRNLDFELERFAESNQRRVMFNREARDRYLAFAMSPDAAWSGNFRDLGASVTRMATLATTGRIRIEAVDEEIGRLKRLWGPAGSQDDQGLARLLGDRMHDIDSFDRAQLCEVLKTCRRAKSLSEAGRMLFAASRKRRSTTNDADRLRKYLARFDLSWEEVTERV